MSVNVTDWLQHQNCSCNPAWKKTRFWKLRLLDWWLTGWLKLRWVNWIEMMIKQWVLFAYCFLVIISSCTCFAFGKKHSFWHSIAKGCVARILGSYWNVCRSCCTWDPWPAYNEYAFAVGHLTWPMLAKMIFLKAVARWCRSWRPFRSSSAPGRILPGIQKCFWPYLSSLSELKLMIDNWFFSSVKRYLIQ